MIYKSCKYIQGGITFRIEAISLCNSWNSVVSENNINLLYPKEKWTKQDLLNLFTNFSNLQNGIRENAKNGILPYKECSTCINLIEKDWDNEGTQFKELQLGHWLNCNCGCCYCTNLPDSHGKITNKSINNPRFELYPLLEYMFENNLIAKDAFWVFNGGECTVLKEFPKIMKLILKQQNTNYAFCFNTNGIKYEKLISKAIKNNINSSNFSGIYISIDASSKETYKKVKRVDKYNDVIKTLKNYVKDLKNNSNHLVCKYIIVENLNDNKEEIYNWIKTCKEIGIKVLQPSLDFCTKIKDRKELTKKMCELYKFMKQEIKNNGMECISIDFLEKFIENESFEIN